VDGYGAAGVGLIAVRASSSFLPLRWCLGLRGLHRRIDTAWWYSFHLQESSPLEL